MKAKMNPRYTGQCLCGEIHYSATTDPVFSGNCYCKDCQRSSGSAFVPAMLFPESTVVISGEPRYFESTADSGHTHQRGFCSNCGSQLFAKFSNFPTLLGIKAGTLNDVSLYKPESDFYVNSAAPWSFMNPQLPKKHGAA